MKKEAILYLNPDNFKSLTVQGQLASGRWTFDGGKDFSFPVSLTWDEPGKDAIISEDIFDEIHKVVVGSDYTKGYRHMYLQGIREKLFGKAE